jgi:ribosome-binding protein aMBF1 (putative translation factor)
MHARSGERRTVWVDFSSLASCEACQQMRRQIERFQSMREETHVEGRRQPLLVSRTWWQLQSPVMYRALKENIFPGRMSL